MAYGQDTPISSAAEPCSPAHISSRVSHNPAVLGGKLLPRLPHPPGTPSQDHPGSGAPPAVPEPSLNPMGWPPSHLRGGPRTEIRPCPPGCDPITPVKGKLVVWKETGQNECGRGSDRLRWGHNAVLAWKLQSLAPVTSTLGHRMLPSPVQPRLQGGCGHKPAEHQTEPDHGPSKFLIRKKKGSMAVSTYNPTDNRWVPRAL